VGEGGLWEVQEDEGLDVGAPDEKRDLSVTGVEEGGYD
jgi:hypothetical protein